MAERVMFIQVKTGHNTDKGPAWISRVRYSKSWQTAYWHGLTLRHATGMFDANFYDTQSGDEYWLSGPHRDRGDTRYSTIRPTVDDDVREIYEAFLDGANWPDHLSRQAKRTRRNPSARRGPAPVLQLVRPE